MTLTPAAVAVEDGWRSRLYDGDTERAVWTADWSEPLECDALAEARVQAQLVELGLVEA